MKNKLFSLFLISFSLLSLSSCKEVIPSSFLPIDAGLYEVKEEDNSFLSYLRIYPSEKDYAVQDVTREENTFSFLPLNEEGETSFVLPFLDVSFSYCEEDERYCSIKEGSFYHDLGFYFSSYRSLCVILYEKEYKATYLGSWALPLPGFEKDLSL